MSATNKSSRALSDDEYTIPSGMVEKAPTARPRNFVPLGPRKRLREHAPTEQWSTTVLREVCGLLDLKSNWDTYGAAPIKRETAMFAIQMLQSVMREQTPTPSVVPSSIGGIQFEWHTNALDLEVHVAGPYDADFWFEDRDRGENIEDTISNDFRRLDEAVIALTVRA